jgi:ferredoxin-NADP reductase
MSMLRALDRRDALGDAVHLHSARGEEEIIFGERLHEIDENHGGFHLHLQITGKMGRMGPADLDELCPDWREREAFISGPGDLLDALVEHWEQAGADPERLHMERFQPIIGREDAEHGEGGTITFTKSHVEATADGTTPILVAGEDAGATLPYGCRMGICHTCVGRLGSGQVRDLRTGEVHGQPDEMIRTCVHAPEGPVEIAL